MPCCCRATATASSGGMIVPTMPCRALFCGGFAAAVDRSTSGATRFVVAADLAVGVHRALHAERRRTAGPDDVALLGAALHTELAGDHAAATSSSRCLNTGSCLPIYVTPPSRLPNASTSMIAARLGNIGAGEAATCSTSPSTLQAGRRSHLGVWQIPLDPAHVPSAGRRPGAGSPDVAGVFYYSFQICAQSELRGSGSRVRSL